MLISREGKFISGLYFPVICLDLIEPSDAAKSRKLILITQLLWSFLKLRPELETVSRIHFLVANYSGTSAEQGSRLVLPSAAAFSVLSTMQMWSRGSIDLLGSSQNCTPANLFNFLIFVQSFCKFFKFCCFSVWTKIALGSVFFFKLLLKLDLKLNLLD